MSGVSNPHGGRRLISHLSRVETADSYVPAADLYANLKYEFWK
jgi:hypothetical protein